VDPLEVFLVTERQSEGFVRLGAFLAWRFWNFVFARNDTMDKVEKDDVSDLASSEPHRNVSTVEPLITDTLINEHLQ
jgi:hypothetical protein